MKYKIAVLDDYQNSSWRSSYRRGPAERPSVDRRRRLSDIIPWWPTLPIQAF
jgi:hypothetical protein